MKKTILFPATNRVHKARQTLLLKELQKKFQVKVVEYEPIGRDMAQKATNVFSFSNACLTDIKPDLLILRGDRFEILPIAMAAAYMGIPIAHIEGGDLSGAIDGKVRHSVSHLADYHFPTNEDSRRRLIQMGLPIDKIWNFGSLDAEFAMSVKPKKIIKDKYILATYHPLPGESSEELEVALAHFQTRAFLHYTIVSIISNNDYYEKYGNQSFPPEEYINLIRYASCIVGNSSSLFKEASVLGTGAVNIGSRQKGRLRTKNIIDVSWERDHIKDAIEYQLDKKYFDTTYYQKDTAKNISKTIYEILR